MLFDAASRLLSASPGLVGHAQRVTVVSAAAFWLGGGMCTYIWPGRVHRRRRAAVDVVIVQHVAPPIGRTGQ
jgi:hypothetical protein